MSLPLSFQWLKQVRSLPKLTRMGMYWVGQKVHLGFFHNILQKNPNEFLSQRSIILLPGVGGKGINFYIVCHSKQIKHSIE